jgi:hypothetical protein
MTAESVAAIADQIAKGVDAKRCTHRIVRGYFIFLYAIEITVDAFAVSASIGSISSEYLEHIDSQKPREKRRLIREKIRGLREYVRQELGGDDNDN